MPTLYEMLENAEGGRAMERLGREFGLSPKETEAAVTALLPAISAGLKRSTATPEGLGNLFAMMGHRPGLSAMYDRPETAFGRDGVAAGNDVLSLMFGSPDVSRAVADQAQQFSGVTSAVLEKLLPVLANILLSGLMRGSGQASPSAPPSSPGGNVLRDILGQIFGREGSPGAGERAPLPQPRSQPAPVDDGARTSPEGDLLGHILREVEKGIREGRIKPVIIGGGGPFQIPMPGGEGQPQPQQVPGGDVLGQILRDILGGGGALGGQAPSQPGRPRQAPDLKDLSDLSKGAKLMGGVGAAVFGDQFEPGRDVEQDHVERIQGLLDRARGGPGRAR